MANQKEAKLYMRELKEIAINEKGEIFWQQVSAVMEMNLQKAFLEGYRYAIRILEDGIVDQEK